MQVKVKRWKRTRWTELIKGVINAPEGVEYVDMWVDEGIGEFRMFNKTINSDQAAELNGRTIKNVFQVSVETEGYMEVYGFYSTALDFPCGLESVRLRLFPCG